MTYERDILVYVNPVSTARHKNEAVIDAIQESEFGSACKIVPSFSADFDENVEHLIDHLDSGMVVASLSGDGLNHAVGNTIIKAVERDTSLSDIAMLTIPTGNANDGALSWHGRRFVEERRFLDCLRHGELLPATTIRVDQRHHGETQTRDGIFYFGIGATAQVAEHYMNPEYRQGRSSSRHFNDARDALTMAREFVRHQPFAYVEDGERQLAHELMWTGVPRMAKNMRWQTEARSPEILEKRFPGDHFMARLAGQLVMRGVMGGLLQTGIRGESLRQPVTLTVPEQESGPVRAQFDGEVVELPENAELTISQRRDAFNMLALVA